MSLFSDLRADQGLKTVNEAFKCLQKTLAQWPGAGPRSLCELRVSEEDYRWLCQWAANLSWGTVKLSRCMAGPLALLLASEAARREAQEGHVWPVMQKRFQSETHQRFFDANGQPSTQLKGLLREAIEELNLRHVLDRKDTLPYYLSIYLQFGFTHKGMTCNLPAWLAGQHLTEAILHLRDPDKGSKSFHQLWSALRNYRRDFVTKEQVRQVIRTSPWVLPSWEADLLRLARENLSLGTESDLEAGPAETEVRPFLLPPRLHWEPPEEPGFSCEVSNLESLDLTADHYHIQMGSAVLAALFRQPDGTYLPDRREASLPCNLAEAVVSVVDPDGRTGVTQTVELWDVQEDVNVFDGVTGRRNSDRVHGRLDPHRGYVLHTAADLTVHPPQLVWRRLGGPGDRLLTLLSPGWPEDLRVQTASGAPLWNPQLSATTTPKQVPSWAERVQVRWLSAGAPVKVGQTLRPMVEGLIPGVCLTYVRLGGRPLPFDPIQGILGDVTVTPELALAGLHFLLGLTCDSQQAQVRSTLKVTILGAARCTEWGWEPLRPARTLTVREAGENVYRLFLPADMGEQKAALMEGSLYSSSAGRRPRPLGRLAGIGAPLVLRRAPYNCPDDLCQLAEAVVDHGIVRNVEFREVDGVFHIRLARPIRPGQGHQVVCWPIRQGFELVGSERIETLEEGRVWRVPWGMRENADRAVVAVAYQGSWRGSAWACKLDGLLPDVWQNPVDPRQTAALVRWSHFPLLRTLETGQQPVFEPFVRSHAADILAVWLFDMGLEGLGLYFDDDADHSRADWAALRTLFDGWQPSEDQVEAVVGLFAQVNMAEPLRALTYWLLPLDPLLAGRLILAWLKTQPSSRTMAAQYMRYLLRLAADLPSGASDYQIRQRQVDALEQAAQTMRADSRSAVDSNFVKEGIADPAVNALPNGALNRVKAVNLAVALQVGSFRHYLGLRVLERVASLI